MADLKTKTWYVTWEGKTISDTDALLRDPKVKETIARLAEIFKRQPKSPRLKQSS